MKIIAKTLLAAGSIALLSVPTVAQEEEEVRTTWQVTAIDVKSGSGNRWYEIISDHLMPAYEAAGLDKPTLHWVMIDDDWDFLIVQEMPDGMATFDTHNPPTRMALFAALVEQEGSEEAVEALFDELNGLEEDSKTLFTHTHP